MQIGDDALSSIIWAGRGILVKMLITLNGMLYIYFDKKKILLILEFEPHQRHCVVVLEQDTFILA